MLINQNKYLHLFSCLALVFIFFTNSIAQDQIYDNPVLGKKINLTIDYIYNLEFDKSEPLIKELELQLKEHPAVYLIKAFDIYWKKKPFKYGSKEFEQFETYLKKCQALAEQLVDENDENIEASFFSLSAHAYLAQLYVENGENLKALSEAKSCYGYIKDGFDLVEQYPEYYFPCGIYDYYREKYPEENPFFKPFLWFFRSGDKENGIEMLKKGAANSIFTKVESNTYLFHILLRYEEKPKQSIPYAKKLSKDYPNNINFTANYVEALIFNNKFEEARPLIDTLLNSKSTYYQYVGKLFLGNFLEKSEKQYSSANEIYKAADALGEKLELRSPHMDSQIYLGMGRSYLKMNNNSKAEEYFKKASKKAEYSLIKNEAKSHINDM